MARDRSKEIQAKRDKSAREKKELVRLKKELDDFVKRHLAAGTAAGQGYETEVRKRQDAFDEYKKAKQAAAAESVQIETEIEALRAAPNSQSRAVKRKIDELVDKAVEARKRARGVKKSMEAAAAKTRSEARSAVVKLRRDLAKARREGQAERVAKLEKNFTKAERRLEKLEANDRRNEQLDVWCRELYASIARANCGTALKRDLETLQETLEIYARLMRDDTSEEDQAIKDAFAEADGATRGGGRLQAAVEKALEAVKPSKDLAFGRKRSRSKEVSESASRNITST
jgi:hypothetical protein